MKKLGVTLIKKSKLEGKLEKVDKKKQQQQQPESIGVQQLELCLIEAVRCCCVV